MKTRHYIPSLGRGTLTLLLLGLCLLTACTSGTPNSTQALPLPQLPLTHPKVSMNWQRVAARSLLTHSAITAAHATRGLKALIK